MIWSNTTAMSMFRQKRVLALLLSALLIVYINWQINLKNFRIFSFIRRNEHLKLYQMLDAFSSSDSEQQQQVNDVNFLFNRNNPNDENNVNSGHFFLLANGFNVSDGKLDPKMRRTFSRDEKLTRDQFARLFNTIYANRGYVLDVNVLKRMDLNSRLTPEQRDNLTRIFKIDHYDDVDQHSEKIFLTFGIKFSLIENLFKVN